MIESMTGFGKATVDLNTRKIEAEIRSLNSRQFDLNLHLPTLYREAENNIRTLLSDKLHRGKIDLFVNMNSGAQAEKTPLNKPLAKEYYRQLKELSEAIGEKNGVYLPLILNMPGLFKTEETATSEELKAIVALVEKAAAKLIKFRTEEGKALKKDMETHLDVIKNCEKEIGKLDRARIDSIRRRLNDKIKEMMDKKLADSNRFEQELIYYIEKLDINEERTRLRTHCSYFSATMHEENCGRKLGFIAQEIGREINTIGSKANDAAIQKLVVEMKDELEKIKEQLMNVL